MELIFLGLFVLFIYWLVKKIKRYRQYKEGSGGIYVKNIETKNKNKDYEIRDLRSQISTRDREINNLNKQIAKLNNDIRTQSNQLKSSNYSNTENLRYQHLNEIENLKRKQQDELFKQREEYEKIIAKYNKSYVNENDDLIQEEALKLAREKAKERLSDMENRYLIMINDIKMEYETKIDAIKDDFEINNRAHIEALAKKLFKEYIEKNFPLD